jgi:hypothetical protein
MKRIVLVVFALVSSACWGAEFKRGRSLSAGNLKPMSHVMKTDTATLAGALWGEDKGTAGLSDIPSKRAKFLQDTEKNLIDRIKKGGLNGTVSFQDQLAMDRAYSRLLLELASAYPHGGMRTNLEEDEQFLRYVNRQWLENEETRNQYINDERIRLRATHGDRGAQAALLITDNKLSRWALEKIKYNQPLFRKLATLAIVGTALALIADKTGFTRWWKNKIDESFRRQRPYTILRRKKGWHTRKGEVILTKNDVKLPPQTARQIDELIVSINRRGEYLKQRGKRANFDSVLLYGPPGTGKTTIARLIADQTVGDDSKPMNLITLMAADFKQVAAEGDRMVVLKEMFDRAEKMGNTIIFLDEIDSMSQERGKSNNERGFIDTLLHLLNKRSPNVMVIGATNHMNLMDEALLSRFRRKIEVGLPTARQRKSILELNVERYLIGDDFESELDTSSIALKMRGASGRDIEAFVLRLRDRLNYDIQSVATMDYADEILREMGYLPPLAEEDALLEDVIAEPEVD